MSTVRAFRKVVFRLHIDPSPRTQSESSAILRHLQSVGSVSFFKINEPAANKSPSSERPESEGTTATIIFASNAIERSFLNSDKNGSEFTVVANDNIPDAAFRDPYNVRGMKSQISAPVARTFKCRIVPTRRPLHSVLDDNEFAQGYTVDRRSILGEILAKTDTPSGMIQGLLPKVENKYAGQEQGANDAQSYENWTEEKKNAMLAEYQKQGIEFKSLNLSSGILKKSNHDVDSIDDEFEMLKDFSLMEVYRQATREVKNGST